jgi:hypothetical protein
MEWKPLTVDVCDILAQNIYSAEINIGDECS